MDDIGGEPHASVIVKVTGGLELVDEEIDVIDSGSSVEQSAGKLVRVVGGGSAGLVRFEVFPDQIARDVPDALVVITPGKLVQEFRNGRGFIVSQGEISYFD